MKKAVVSDLDGTLAFLGDRDPYREQHNLMQDTLNINLKKVLDLYTSDGHELIILTGRWESYRHLTNQWLAKHGLVVDDNLLFMRPMSNYDTGPRLKQWYLENILQNQYAITIAFEDMYQIAKMFRKHDIPCWQVNADPWDKTV
jgi:hypothetical protein